MAKRARQTNSDVERLQQIKRLALIALVSDNKLLDRLVLKGGSALDLVHGIGKRASIDLDFSIEGDFDPEELAGMEKRLERLLDSTFREHGYRAFDVRFRPKPPDVSPEMADFWGGYGLKFKLARIEDTTRLGENIEAQRRRATIVGPAQRKTFEIDISRYECCADKEEQLVDGFTVFVYSPRLIVSEKLRAVCQQMPEYRKRVRSSHAAARARDFFDICNVVERFNLQTGTTEFLGLTESVFACKRVPMDLLWRIGSTREFHRPDFQTVRDTVPTEIQVQEFDYYFDFVVDLVSTLKALRNS